MSFQDQVKQGIACDSVGKPDSAIGRAVCLSVHPGKMILFPFLHWFRQHYEGKYRFARIIFGFDLMLIGIAIALSSIAIYAHLFFPKTFLDQITFESTIAPREVTTGAPATIVMRYANNTQEELQNVHISIQYPKYFVLQSFEPDQGEIVDEQSFSLASIAPGSSGTIHLKGVLFGDVGGEQVFQTKMNFTHGEQKTFEEKIDWHIFHPTRSALSLTLDLPERFSAFQPIEGVVRYTNTSNIDFPVVSLLPHWPEGFTLLQTDTPLLNGQFELPEVQAGETGEFRFEGILNEDTKQVTFVFDPSFTFGNDRFKQETLIHTAPVVPLPLHLQTRVDQKTAIAGSTMPVLIEFTNTSDQPIQNVLLSIEAEHPIVQNISTHEVDMIQPGETLEVSVDLKLASKLLASQLSEFEQLNLSLRTIATYKLDQQTGQTVTSKSPILTIPITTPVQLESFVRYTTPGGDQIGRGPVPPQPEQETTYWIFWHITGTTNALTNVRLEAELPDGIRFTGRQTVSQDSPVVFDTQSQTVLWTSPFISPTLAPNSKIVGIAFEVGITPEAELTSAPVLLKNIRLTAVDNHTGEFVSAYGGSLKALMEE